MTEPHDGWADLEVADMDPAIFVQGPVTLRIPVSEDRFLYEVQVPPNTVTVTMLDGEEVQYERSGGSLHGPCPGCWARARMLFTEADAVKACETLHAVESNIPIDGDLPRRGDGSHKRSEFYPPGQRHPGCFEGQVVLTMHGYAWHTASNLRDWGINFAR